MISVRVKRSGAQWTPKVDVVVFGCTHYPLLKPLLTQLFPENVRFFDPAVGLDSHLDNVLGSLNSSQLAPISLSFSIPKPSENGII